VARGLAWTAYEIKLSEPMYIEVPKIHPKWREMNGAELADAQAGNTRTMYRATIWNLESWSAKHGRYTEGTQALVNAVDGRTIVLYPVLPAFLVAGRSLPPGTSSPKPSTPSLLDGEWSVITANTKNSPKGRLTRAEGASTASGREVLLTQGSFTLRAQFDSKSGLVWIERDGKSEIAMASGKLLESLKSLPTEASKPFGSES
jgi:hypothetical protein